MASYDKEKLLRMIARRRQAHMALLDLADRRREARSDASLRRSMIYEKADYKAARDGYVDRLMRLSYEEACKLDASEIQGFTRQLDATTRIAHDTGINAESYRKYIAARERAERLTAEYEAAAQEFSDRFQIVAQLVTWVKERGFNDPELEAL